MNFSNHKISIIGLGIMGTALANLLKKMEKLDSTYDKNHQKGPNNIESINDLKSDICILCLPSSVEVESVLEQLKKTEIKYIVDHTTNEPEKIVFFKKTMSKLNITYLNCPLVGGVRSIRDNKIVSIVPECSYKGNLKNIIDIYVKEKIFARDLISAAHLKLLHNFVTISNSVSFIEAYNLSQKMGVDTKTFFNTIQSGTADSYVSRNTLIRTLMNNNYSDGYKSYLVKKDMKYVKRISQKYKTSLNILKTINRYIDLSVKCDGDQLDYPIIHKVI